MLLTVNDSFRAAGAGVDAISDAEQRDARRLQALEDERESASLV